MSIAALLTIAKTRRQPESINRCADTDDVASLHDGPFLSHKKG